ncbi:MAG: hypothetical protein K0R70_2078, partial [Steroidobacteraceae bacterium]|nr:hypothetical protein [Steroidobacteraceae bacterium]
FSARCSCKKNPGDAEKPIAEVFYETATAYPCR